MHLSPEGGLENRRKRIHTPDFGYISRLLTKYLIHIQIIRSLVFCFPILKPSHRSDFEVDVELVSQLKLAKDPIKVKLSNSVTKFQVFQYLYFSIFFKTCSGGVILQTVLFWCPEVSALVLSDFDLPGPGDGGGGGVDVQVDHHTGVTGGHPHVLASVVATDDRWRGEPRNTD